MTIHEIWIMGHLLLNSWTDLHTREISVLSTVLLGIGGISFFGKERTWEDMAFSFSIGGMLFLLGLLSEGSVGGGGGLFITALGLNMKWELLIEILILAFGLCAVSAVVKMLICRTEQGQSLPFIPFLLAAGIKVSGVFYL